MTNTTTVTLNEATVELVTAFVKANKVSNTKITDLIQQVLVLNGVSAPRGRTASETILALRAKFKENMAELKNVTAKEVAENHVEAGNTLAFFEKSGEFTRVGLKEHAEGARGRREVIWSSVN